MKGPAKTVRLCVSRGFQLSLLEKARRGEEVKVSEGKGNEETREEVDEIKEGVWVTWREHGAGREV